MDIIPVIPSSVKLWQHCCVREFTEFGISVVKAIECTVTCVNSRRVRVKCYVIKQCAKIGYFLLFSAIFSWRDIASQYHILMFGFAGHIYSWLATARQEKITFI